MIGSFNISDKRVLKSLYDCNMSNKCLKAGWCFSDAWTRVKSPFPYMTVAVLSGGEQLSIAGMTSAAFNHNTPWRAEHMACSCAKVTIFNINMCLRQAALCWAVLPRRWKGRGSRSRCSSRQNRWGRPCDSTWSHKAVQRLISWQHFIFKHVGKRSSVTGEKRLIDF